MTTDWKTHWEHIHASKDPEVQSWYEPTPTRSMSLIRGTGVSPEAPLIDVGAGTSTLVDILTNSGYSDVTVLDIALAAITKARERLGAKAASIQWLETDVRAFEASRRYYLWHDRAMLHFLTEAASVNAYLNALRTALVPGGYFVLATYGPEAPDRCSGFDVQRYSVEQLTDLLQADFDLQEYALDDHTTPTGTIQQFLYSSWKART